MTHPWNVHSSAGLRNHKAGKMNQSSKNKQATGDISQYVDVWLMLQLSTEKKKLISFQNEVGYHGAPLPEGTNHQTNSIQ